VVKDASTARITLSIANSIHSFLSHSSSSYKLIIKEKYNYQYIYINILFKLLLTGSAIGDTFAPSLIFFSRIPKSRIILLDGIESIAPNVFSLADSLHNSCNTYFGIKDSGGAASLSPSNLNYKFKKKFFIKSFVL